jgi:hypothetical protein
MAKRPKSGKVVATSEAGASPGHQQMPGKRQRTVERWEVWPDQVFCLDIPGQGFGQGVWDQAGSYVRREDDRAIGPDGRWTPARPPESAELEPSPAQSQQSPNVGAGSLAAVAVLVHYLENGDGPLRETSGFVRDLMACARQHKLPHAGSLNLRTLPDFIKVAVESLKKPFVDPDQPLE